MRGVSANIMMGQYGCYGTNAIQLVLDSSFYLNKRSEEENEKEEVKEKEKEDASVAVWNVMLRSATA
jgi:hypothetical protein